MRSRHVVVVLAGVMLLSLLVLVTSSDSTGVASDTESAGSDSAPASLAADADRPATTWSNPPRDDVVTGWPSIDDRPGADAGGEQSSADKDTARTMPDRPNVPQIDATTSTTPGAPTSSGTPSTNQSDAQTPGSTPATTATPGTTAADTTDTDTTDTDTTDTGTPTTNPPANNPPATNPPATNPPATDPAPAGNAFAGINVGDHTNPNAIISFDGQDGSFRTACTVSHFNFDDAIVFPGIQNATHLHMYFGNTLADHRSTGASLAAAGDGSCQGGPLNRSAYWVPAVLDQNGDVRPAQYMLTYYKRAGDEDVVPFPNGLKIVVGNAMAHDPQPGREQPVGAGIDYNWHCGSPISGGAHSHGRLIPDCSPGEFLTLSLIFPRCGDGRLDSADHKSHMAYPPYYGGPCPASHPIRHPQLTYNIHWNNNDTNTGGWYLSSDDHRDHGDGLLPGGTTTHADWIGAWHPEVLDIMTTGCFNADHDCKGATISPTLRLNEPPIQGYSPPNIYNAGVAPSVIPLSQFR